jgi:hypothetical protein
MFSHEINTNVITITKTIEDFQCRLGSPGMAAQKAKLRGRMNNRNEADGCAACLWLIWRTHELSLTRLRRLSKALTHNCPIRAIKIGIAIYGDRV